MIVAYQRSTIRSLPRAGLNIDAHLENWAAWMRHRGCGGYELQGGVSGSTDFDAMCDAMDRKNAAILNALIEDLPAAQCCAVYARYLSLPFKFPRQNKAQLLNAARETLREKLAERGVV